MASAKAAARFLGEVAPAIAIVVPAIGIVWGVTERASWATLGRDQGIFQYVAWAVSEGDIAYRDVRDVNGPVITIVHTAFQLLGGTDEHRFRVLDLVCTALSFGIAGALVPGIAGVRRVALRVRAAWALATWVALSAQYLAYGFWDTAQRESFLDWFVVVSLALQASSVSSGELRTRTTRATLFASGFLSFVSWLGKPTFALFTLPQLVALAIEPGALRDRARRLGWFFAGGVLGVALPLVWVARRGDLRAWAQITFVDVPTMYRFIWHRPASAIFALPGYSALVWTSVLTTFGLVALVVLRRLPTRALPIAVMPVLALASVVAQAKGFPYHFHPVTLGFTFAWIVALSAVWQHAPRATRAGVVLAMRAAAITGALVVGAHATLLSWQTPFPSAPFPSARDAASLESAERLSAFDRIDYFPRAMRDTAAFVAAHTRPDDRVQLYGMDAYLLFLARRRSATPYIYAYDLNADAAIHGSFDDDGLVPTAEQAARIGALRDGHARDLLARVVRAPPAAFVFVDRSPLMSGEDAVTDFEQHCPEAAVWMSSHYRQVADFDGLRVWLPIREASEAREAREPH